MFTYAVVSRLVELKSEKDSNEKMGKRRCMVEACGKKKKIQRWAQSMKVFESYANIHKKIYIIQVDNMTQPVDINQHFSVITLVLIQWVKKQNSHSGIDQRLRRGLTLEFHISMLIYQLLPMAFQQQVIPCED